MSLLVSVPSKNVRSFKEMYTRRGTVTVRVSIEKKQLIVIVNLNIDIIGYSYWIGN